MILGRITGKHTTSEFQFEVVETPRKFDFVQVMHKEYGFVLAQIVSLIREEQSTLAKCRVVGYRDPDGKIKPLRTPFESSTEVLLAEDQFIKDIIELKDKDGAFIGHLESKKIPVFLDLRSLLTKHVAVLAKSGAGKSYTVGVLLEEIIERRVPLVIIDPHGEYSKIKYPNTQDAKKLAVFGIQPANYIKQIVEYGINSDLKPLLLSNNLSGAELVHLLPAKLSNSQLTLLYSAIKDLETVNFETLLLELERAENNTKWNLISIIDYLRKLNLFSETPTNFNELVAPGRCSIINLKGVPPEIQEIVVYKLAKDLFEQRKLGAIPPLFMVVEEAHNFCPERAFGEAKSSKILRTIASEGRKFGLGLCVISQRPARVDKSVLSQITTQIILKVTNPNDLKALSNSIEGLTMESEEEIQNLPIGSALVTGVVDIPLIVNVRPRKTQHGGHAVDILEEVDKDKYLEEIQEFENKDLLAVIKPKISLKEIELMSEQKISKAHTHLVPCTKILCERRGMEFSLLIDLVNGQVVRDVEQNISIPLPDLNGLNTEELKILDAALHVRMFSFSQIRTRMQLNLTKNSFKRLVKKELLREIDNEQYQITDHMQLLINPKEFESFVKIEYASIAYDKKLDIKFPIDEIKNRLNRFVDVKDTKECFLMRYEISYAQNAVKTS